MATRSFLADVSAEWNRRGGDEALFESVGGVTALARVCDGEPFDVVVIADDAIETLSAADRVIADSRVALARSDVIVVAVRHGARRAEIDRGADPSGIVDWRVEADRILATLAPPRSAATHAATASHGSNR